MSIQQELKNHCSGTQNVRIGPEQTSDASIFPGFKNVVGGKQYENLMKELEKGLGQGDLTLIVACTKCDANFELNKESVAVAIMKETPFIEYLRWIQSSKCLKCNKQI